jgi:rhodanese-related sulfurtransferase
MQQLNVNDLDELMENGEKPALIDVREPWEYQLCHIDGSQLIPMRQIPNAIEELDPEQKTVVICHTGMRSQQVCIYLEQAGFSDVNNLMGGVHAWATQIDLSMATY